MSGQCLHGKFVAIERPDKVGVRLGRINSGQRLQVFSQFSDDAVPMNRRLHKSAQPLLRHEGHVDRESEKMRTARLRKHGGQTTERSAWGRGVAHQFHIRWSPRRIGARGDEQLLWIELAQQIQLALPKRFALEKQHRFIATHAARFAASQQDGAQFHAMILQRMAADPKEQRDDIGSGRIIRRTPEGSFDYRADDLAVEAPLEIRVGDESVAVTMRTPGHDEELAAGFLVSESLVRERTQIRRIVADHSDANGSIAKVTLVAGLKLKLQTAQRYGTISTSCGLCGKNSIAAIHQQFPALARTHVPRVTAKVLLSLPDRLRAEQENFARTGGLHAAALFDLDGQLLIAREDVGRHNAVDKVIGRAFLDGRWPLARHLLFVSGRASFEIVQKALAAQLPIVASVSAPSTLAMEFARASGQTLISFLRPPTFNIYSHVDRVIMEETVASLDPARARTKTDSA